MSLFGSTSRRIGFDRRGLIDLHLGGVGVGRCLLLCVSKEIVPKRRGCVVKLPSVRY
jgi:hypothetical protein